MRAGAHNMSPRCAYELRRIELICGADATDSCVISGKRIIVLLLWIA